MQPVNGSCKPEANVAAFASVVATAPNSRQVAPLNNTNDTRPRAVPNHLVSKLNKKLPDEAVQPHPTKSWLSTIKTIYAIERLNAVFGIGGWTYRTQIVENDPTKAMVVVKVVLMVPEYGIQLEQFGGNNNEDRGDAYKGAVTDALSKLCGYLGIGMDVYKGHAPTQDDPNRGRQQRKLRQTVPAKPAEPASVAQPAPAPTVLPAAPDRAAWFALSRAARIQSFRDLEHEFPPDDFYGTLEAHGVALPDQFKSANVAWACYEKLWHMARESRHRHADADDLAPEGRVA